MRWLLDTNVVSEPIQARPNREVLAWLGRQPDDLLAISIVTLAELREGALSNQNARRRGELMRWLDVTIASWLGERTLALTLEILMDWLDVGRRLRRQGMPRDPADLLIASTARVRNLIIVSRNARDFAGTGVVVYDPWKSETHRTELA